MGSPTVVVGCEVAEVTPAGSYSKWVVVDLDTAATHVDPATTQLSSTVPASALMELPESTPRRFRQAHREGQAPQPSGIPVSANRFAALTEDARAESCPPSRQLVLVSHEQAPSPLQCAQRFHVGTESESESSTEEILTPPREENIGVAGGGHEGPTQRGSVRRRRRRFLGPHQSEVAPQDEPLDSHDERLRRVRRMLQQDSETRSTREVRVAVNAVRSLVERIGHWEVSEGVPRELRRQQWSMFNVPIMWAAASGDRSCGVLQWVAQAAQDLSIPVCGSEMTGSEAVFAGWEGLQSAMNSWGIRSRGLSEWLHGQGFPQPRWGAHFSGRAQERILNMAVNQDGRVAALEAAYVQIVLGFCERGDPGTIPPQTNPLAQPEPSVGVPWAVVDSVNLSDFFRERWTVLQSCPFQFRGRFRQAVQLALEARSEAVTRQDAVMEERAWKLFCILPVMLLRKPRGQGKVGRDELSHRFDKFARGQWATMLQEAQVASRQEGQAQRLRTEDTPGRRAEAACQKVKLGEVSRARMCLTGASLAPGTEETYDAMQNRRPQEVVRNIPQNILEFELDTPVQVDQKVFLKCLKNAPRGSSPGPGGCTHEHLRILVDDVDTMELLFEAVTSLAQARVPVTISRALMSARLTALKKADGGVRGIATGCTFRRLVARTLARQFAKDFEEECAPFQYALSTRAGTDCVGHFLRAATDTDPQATILSVDGIGAYDHVLRAAMLGRLARMPKARAILPFVRLSYASPSEYSWVDDTGRSRIVHQAEGGEQGDPLMPLLFSVGIQDALEEVARSLQAGEQLCAYLDDVYLLCQPDRVVTLFEILSESMFTVAGIRLHQGKTKAWNRAGAIPEDGARLGAEAWQKEGITVLGTPIGSTQFVLEKIEARITEERRLWDAIPAVPDLQCAWQILVQSANPRANHTLRTLPPSLAQVYGEAHDAGIWNTVVAIMQGLPGSDIQITEAQQVATLPMRMGGLGLRSATRCPEAAYWASWADALHMVGQRNPEVADMVVRTVSQREPPREGCLAELHQAGARLDREGFWWRPTWQALRDGARPEENVVGEPGEWQHGWQYWASSVSDSFYRKTSLLPVRPAASRAHLRSHSGSNAGTALAHAPTSPEYTIPPHLFRVIVLERPVQASPIHARLTLMGHSVRSPARQRAQVP